MTEEATTAEGQDLNEDLRDYRGFDDVNALLERRDAERIAREQLLEREMMSRRARRPPSGRGRTPDSTYPDGERLLFTLLDDPVLASAARRMLGVGGIYGGAPPDEADRADES